MIDLLELRDEIDVIDKQITELFLKRMDICSKVAEYKINTGKQVLDTKREKDKIEKVKSYVEDDFMKHGVAELFMQIMAMSRKLQYRLLEENNIHDEVPLEKIEDINRQDITVVYPGVPGAYSEQAMINYFGENVNHFNVVTFREAMDALRDKKADYAVFPIENSSAGIVNDTYDLLKEYDNYIVAETFVKIEHALLGTADSDISDIRTVYSHPQGLMQCQEFLEEHKEWNQISLANTAIAARKVKDDGDKTQVAIASKIAARNYGLKILKEAINTNSNNTTRFVIVSNKPQFTKDADKISICFETPNEAGSLYNMLSHIIYNGLNMTRIESRPLMDGNFGSRFYVDFEGCLTDASVKNALRGISSEAITYRLLGNYR
ncbi:MAG: prephenate dehydratase [Lachnospiraceae bacterium]|nr:prephenate dehydratase [Lachnospiraceae bacterium]